MALKAKGVNKQKVYFITSEFTLWQKIDRLIRYIKLPKHIEL